MTSRRSLALAIVVLVGVLSLLVLSTGTARNDPGWGESAAEGSFAASPATDRVDFADAEVSTPPAAEELEPEGSREAQLRSEPTSNLEEVSPATTFRATILWQPPAASSDHESLLGFIREAVAREAWSDVGNLIEHLMKGAPPGWVLQSLLALPPERLTGLIIDAMRRHGRGDQAELLVDRIGGGSIVVRQAAIRALGSFRSEVSREALLWLLADDPRTDIRATVARALEGDLAPAVTAALLERFLDDPVRSVAQQAASSLRRRDTREVAHVLLARIGRGEVPQDRALEAWSIVCESPLEIEEYLPALADSARRAGDMDERRLLVRLIASTGETAAVPVLIALYRENDDSLIHTHVLGGLENSPAPEVDPFLRAESLSHPSKVFQERARQILERRGAGPR